MATERFRLEFDADSTIGQNMVRLLSDQLATTSVIVTDYGAVCEMHQGGLTGQPCRQCASGHLTIYSTKTKGATATRYFSCFDCGWRPPFNTEKVPAKAVQKKHPRSVTRSSTETVTGKPKSRQSNKSKRPK